MGLERHSFTTTIVGVFVLQTKKARQAITRQEEDDKTNGKSDQVAEGDPCIERFYDPYCFSALSNAIFLTILNKK
jgi:hypothetical protein